MEQCWMWAKDIGISMPPQFAKALVQMVFDKRGAAYADNNIAVRTIMEFKRSKCLFTWEAIKPAVEFYLSDGRLNSLNGDLIDAFIAIVDVTKGDGSERVWRRVAEGLATNGDNEAVVKLKLWLRTLKIFMFLFTLVFEFVFAGPAESNQPGHSILAPEDRTGADRSQRDSGLPSSLHPSDIFAPLLPSYRCGPPVHRLINKKRRLDLQGRKPAEGVHQSPLRKRRRSNATRVLDHPRLGALSIEWFEFEEVEEAEETGVMGEAMRDGGALAPADATRATGPRERASAAPSAEATGRGPLADSGGSAGPDTISLLHDHASAPQQQPTVSTSDRATYIIPTSGAFIHYKTGATQLNAGILHLYRDRSEVKDILEIRNKGMELNTKEGVMDRVGSKPPILNPPPRLSKDDIQKIKGDGTVLCVLAVPSYMTSQDFLNFIGGSSVKNMSHLRIIRDSIPNRYMVLIKFRTCTTADAFYREFSGRRFNSLDAEVCHVVYVRSIEFKSQAIPPYAFSLGMTTEPDAKSSNASSPPFSTLSDSVVNRQPVIAPIVSPAEGIANLVELPNCPVCLDRMDSTVTGLLTIVCHHTFHCHCLSKWGDTSCPVCRYSQTPDPASSQYLQYQNDALNECADCGAHENLWICLICGNLGCGRYHQKHAQFHFEETNHVYSLELETQRVWDYVGDGYVHRLIQNKSDGKLVELPPPSMDGTGRGRGIFGGDGRRSGGDGEERAGADSPFGESEAGELFSDDALDLKGGLVWAGKGKGNMLSQEKLDAIGLEYTYLLTSQLESQRLWYETQIAELLEHRQAEEEAMALAMAVSSSMESGGKPGSSSSPSAIVPQAEGTPVRPLPTPRPQRDVQLPTLLKEKRVMEKRLERLTERLESLEIKFAEEREINEALRKNQDVYKSQLGDKERELEDMREQLRDLMVYLEVGKRVEESELREELREGTLVVEEAGTTSTGKVSGKGRRGRRK
ncbi:hypothetical protein HK101_001822 [Irineochytrium annulatum]|nr:hypothetical protein HK101_001822 [Irineochytrium annulatum]